MRVGPKETEILETLLPEGHGSHGGDRVVGTIVGVGPRASAVNPKDSNEPQWIADG